LKISRLWNTGAAVTGLLFAIMLAFGALASISPYADLAITSSSETIAQSFVAGVDNLVTGGYVLMMSAFLLVVFGGYLRHAISERAGTVWPATVGFGGAILTGALLTFIAMFIIAQGQLSDYGDETVIARTLLLLAWVSTSMVIPGLAAFVGGMSVMALSYKTLPRWVGWLGVLSTLAILTFWTLGILLSLVWVAIVSILMVIREARSDDPAEGETTES